MDMLPCPAIQRERDYRHKAVTGAAIAAALILGLSDSADAGSLAELADTGRELCRAAELDHDAMAGLIGAEPQDERERGPAGQALRTERTFRKGNGKQLRLILDRPREALLRVILERHLPAEHVGKRPDAMVLLDGGCTLGHARQLRYGEEGYAIEVAVYDPELNEIAPPEPLNPPMPEGPPGETPDGVVVALFDSGLAYTLESVASRMAYDGSGQAFGYDFWDMNDRPFDADTSRSPFFPTRHGTLVASVLLREAPEARVAPFRYPRPDMDRMTDMVAAAAEAGARIVQMPMGSNDSSDWTAFEAAARAHPDMLFVLSAGNDNRNLDEEPLWPAALRLDNAVVVTSSEDDGELAFGSNWGRETVDLMVPAENVEVLDHRGDAGRAAGTSFAVPRVAALAARILGGKPEMSVAELKEALFDRAQPAEGVRYGVILDPAAD